MINSTGWSTRVIFMKFGSKLSKAKGFEKLERNLQEVDRKILTSCGFIAVLLAVAI